MSLSRDQRDFASKFGEFLVWLTKEGYEYTFGEAFRTLEQHAWNLTNGKSKAKISKHCDRLAFDLMLWVRGEYSGKPEDYRIPGQKWEEMGGKWGGRFGLNPEEYETKIGFDSNHFEW